MGKRQIEISENSGDIDWSHLHAFVCKAFAYMDARIDPPSSLCAMDAKAFEQKARDEVLVLARYQEQIVGCLFCMALGDWLYVGKVAVAEDLQGHGIGRRMFDYAFELARREGLAGLELQTRIELLENHRVFSKLGFSKVGEDTHEGFNQPTSIRMRACV